jgi:hypothetical protein
MALTTRALARRLVTVAAMGTLACYSAGGGTAPPPNSFYFPVGLVVSTGGNVLYAVNSDFDLQWNGGTLQSYDLFEMRRHAAELVWSNENGNVKPPDVPFNPPWQPGCPFNAPPTKSDGYNGHQPLGQTCAPPVDSTQYVRDSAIIGAFATDLQLSKDGRRLFSPVRGDAAIVYANVGADDPATAPNDTDGPGQFGPFQLDCGPRGSDNRCDASHTVGNDANSEENTRHVTMPGEPFGMAQSQDGKAIVITHQTQTESSLLTTGYGGSSASGNPTMQFVLSGVPNGGNGIAAVPHDFNAVHACDDDKNVKGIEPCVHEAFLQTSRTTAEIDLLRYYSDDGSSLGRPFLQKEAAYTLTSNSGGTDSRGIVIDDTPRTLCLARGGDPVSCGQTPARVYFANRTPASLVVGQIGVVSPVDGSYDPDRLELLGNIPLTPGPSRVYLAPIIDGDGLYELRIFVVCFDSNSIFVIDPNAGLLGEVENVIFAGPGPFAMAFDPFLMPAVARNDPAPPQDPRFDPKYALRPYRFAYVANFTQSFVQVIDLDNSRTSKASFERVVFTLGQPTLPKGQGG